MKKIIIISSLFFSLVGFSQSPDFLGSWVSADSMRVKKLRLFVETGKSYGAHPKLYTYSDSLWFWNGSEEFNLTSFVVYPETDPDFHAQVRDSSYLVLTDSIISVLESYGFYLSMDSGYISKGEFVTLNVGYAEIGNLYDTSETQTLVADSLAAVHDSISALYDSTAAHRQRIEDLEDSSLWEQTLNVITPKTATKMETDSIDVNVFELPKWKYYIDNDTLKTSFWNGATWVLIKKEYE